MRKLFSVGITIGIVAACYLVMMVVMPVVGDLIVTSNATITSSVNVSNFPGSSSVMVSSVWWLWFVPATIGIAIVIIILKS